MPGIRPRKKRHAMPVDPATRARIAAEQARLLATLVADAEPPPGFDPPRLAATTHTLHAKKHRAAPAAPPRQATTAPPRAWWQPLRDLVNALLP